MQLRERSKNKASAIDELELICRGKTMAIDDKIRDDPESKFSFGVREMQQATAIRELSLDKAPRKAANEKLGFDPYNTSGSFDRKKNWMRVGKR
jgi:hypothetical protein